ncbi:energy transducer TonB [Flavobacterium microcysteis]|uniref:Energy transducer TonB n=1 Tax=Flavobacterium microcysteis TaxID=2596891 RepID=A0A501Q786_9FLAO|nr:energy transducer TonB [Flavobacterium microcysteis]TPD68268.1 energy transducer TonB [Flavobacterium microcysteis]
MKSAILSALFLMMPIFLLAQDVKDKKTFLDSLENPTVKEDYKYYRIVKNYNIPSESYEIRNYYRSGKLYGEGKTIDSLGFNITGKFTTYYENGNKKSEGNYMNSNPTGPHKTWYENGKLQMDALYFEKEKTVGNLKISQFYDATGKQTVKNGNGTYEEEMYGGKSSGKIKNGLKEGEWKGSNTKTKATFIEFYKEGDLVSGESTDSDSQKYPYREIFENPEPTKGMPNFYKFVSTNFHIEDDITPINDKIIVSFIVEKDGSVTSIKILKGLGGQLDREAKRIIKKYNEWKPGKIRGMTARASLALPIAIHVE